MSTPIIRKRNRTWSPAVLVAPAPSPAAEPHLEPPTGSGPSDANIKSGEDARVGHCRPPQHTRFGQPGGNRPGRKRGSKNRRTVLDEELRAKVDVNGQMIEKFRIGARQLANGMAKGDPKFLLAALKLGIELDPAKDAPPDAVEVPLDTHERSLFDIMKEMFGAGGPTALRADGSPR
jgi:hypothetical protein